MRLKLIIFSDSRSRRNEPEEININNNYAIETLLIKVSEKFFGIRVSRQIEDLLKVRIDKEDEL